ncbi:hypothetical protein CEW89_08370 [Celeribacter ethanolicus]|uniref:Uncharacterized protein n=1 Tax=Celeribacter ethanolicus TaxID=1758178 RepID=A0A291GBQ6_9RHOB|nr:hypothetical protein [Celeribacter ethanolicus]ATG47587.1 hypothetical protein CEW89_08370 [Celeribacter ethanolicus]
MPIAIMFGDTSMTVQGYSVEDNDFYLISNTEDDATFFMGDLLVMGESDWAITVDIPDDQIVSETEDTITVEA